MWQFPPFYRLPNDGRFEVLAQGRWYSNVLRDSTAGLIVAMRAIPSAMGLAVASGQKLQKGSIGGASADPDLVDTKEAR